MQSLEVSGAVRSLYESLGIKGLKALNQHLEPYEVILKESNVILFYPCVTNPSILLVETACNHLTHRFHLNIIEKLV